MTAPTQNPAPASGSGDAVLSIPGKAVFPAEASPAVIRSADTVRNDGSGEASPAQRFEAQPDPFAQGTVAAEWYDEKGRDTRGREKRSDAFRRARERLDGLNLSTSTDIEAQAAFIEAVRTHPLFGYLDPDGSKTFGPEAGFGKDNARRFKAVLDGSDPSALYTREYRDWKGLAPEAQADLAMSQRTMPDLIGGALTDGTLAQAALGFAHAPASSAPAAGPTAEDREAARKDYEKALMEKQRGAWFRAMTADMSDIGRDWVKASLDNGAPDPRSIWLVPEEDRGFALAAYRTAKGETDVNALVAGAMDARDSAKGMTVGAAGMLGYICKVTGGRSPEGGLRRKSLDDEEIMRARLADAAAPVFKRYGFVGEAAKGLIGSLPLMMSMSNPYTGVLATMGMAEDARRSMLSEGINPETAAAVGFAVGVVNSRIEKMQWEKMTGGGMSELELRTHGLAAMARALKKFDFVRTGEHAAKMAGHGAKVWATELAEEVLQNLDQEAGVQYANNDLDVKSFADTFFSALEQANPTTFAFGAVAATGLGASVGAGVRRLKYGEAVHVGDIGEIARRRLAALHAVNQADGADVAPAEKRARADALVRALRTAWRNAPDKRSAVRCLEDAGLDGGQVALLDDLFQQEAVVAGESAAFRSLYRAEDLDADISPEAVRAISPAFVSAEKVSDSETRAVMRLADGTEKAVLFRKGDTSRQADPARFDEQVRQVFGQAAWDEADEAGRGLMRSRVSARAFFMTSDGAAVDADGVITIAAPDGQGGGARMGDLYHETFHAATVLARNAGVLTDGLSAALRGLFGEARSEGETFDEEIAADAYAPWLAGKAEDKSGAFAAIRDFFRRIWSAVYKQPAAEADGAWTVDNVFEAVRTGNLSGLPAVSGVGTDSAAVRQTPGPVRSDAAQPAASARQNPGPVKSPDVSSNSLSSPVKVPDPAERGKWSSVTPQGNVRVAGVWEAVPLDSLVTSDRLDYDQTLQPRDRSSVGSRQQVQDILTKFDAPRLFDSAETDGGAPVIGGGRQVVSGNGRTMALRKLAQSGRWGEYDAEMRARAAALGVAVPSGMDNPVLVRRVTRIPAGSSLQQVAELSNRPKILTRSPAELAEADAKAIRGGGLAAVWSPGADGSVTSAGNRPFLSAFVRAAGDPGLYDSNANPTDVLENRVRRAMLALVVGEGTDAREVIRALVENAGDLGMRREVDGVTRAAGSLVALADAKPVYDLLPDVSQALRDYMQFRRDKAASMADWLAQRDLFATRPPAADALLKAFDARRAAGGVAAFLQRYAELARGVDLDTPDMFGAAPASKAELVARAEADTMEDSAAGRFSLKLRTVDTTGLPDRLAEVVAPTAVSSLAQAKFINLKREHARLLASGDFSAAEAYALGLDAPGQKPLRDYLLAKKHGYANEARRTVSRWARKETVAEIRGRLDADKPVVFVPVLNREGNRMNALPLAFARWLAKQFGGEVWTDLVKVSEEHNTGASQTARAGREYVFEGTVPVGVQVVLVDDVWTSGQTLWSLYEHVLGADAGADVRAFAALASGRYGKNVKPTAEQLTKMLGKASLSAGQFKEATGNDASKLTGGEIQGYLLNGGAGVGGVLSRFGGDDLFSGGVHPEGSAGVSGGVAAAGTGRSDSQRVAGSWGPEQTNLRFSVRLNGNPEDIAAAVIAAKILRGQGVTEATVGKMLAGMGSKTPAADVLGRARAVSEGYRAQVRHAAESDAELLETLRKASMEKRYFDRIDAAANVAFAEGSEEAKAAVRMDEARRKVMAREIENAGGFAAATLELEYGVDFAESLLASPVVKASVSGAGERGESSAEAGAVPDLSASSASVSSAGRPVPVSAEALAALERIRKRARVRAEADKAARSEAALRREKAAERYGVDMEADAAAAAGSGEAAQHQAARASTKRDAFTIDDPAHFRAMLEEMVIDRLSKRAGFKPDRPFESPAALREFALTAKHVLTDLAAKLDPSGTREGTRLFLEKLTEYKLQASLEGAVENAFSRIHGQMIAESREKLISNLERDIRVKAGARGAFQRGGDETRRTVEARVEEWARIVLGYLRMTDAEIEAETKRLSGIIDGRAKAAADAPAGADGYELQNDRDTQKARDQLAVLTFLHDKGPLSEMMPGRISDKAAEILEQIETGRANLEKRRGERDERTQLWANQLAAAFVNPSGVPMPEPGRWGMMADSTISSVRLRLLDLVKYSTGDARKRALAVIGEVDYMLSAAAETKSNYIQDAREAMRAALVRIYGSEKAGATRWSEKLSADVWKQLNSQGGLRTVGEALQLYVGIIQDDYKGNSASHGRDKQLALLKAQFTEQDLAFVSYLVQTNRVSLDALNSALIPVQGLPVQSTGELYMPVRMKQNKGGMQAKVKAWTALPAWLVPRVRNMNDFDETADIYNMWDSRMQDTAHTVAYAETGLELASIFGRDHLQEAVLRSHGKDSLKKILSHVTDTLRGGRSDDVTEGAGAFADTARAVVSRTTLAYNAGSALKQVAAFPAFALHDDVGLTGLLSHMVRVDPAAIRDLVNSPGFRARYGGGMSEEIMNAMRGNRFGWLARVYNAGFEVPQFGDKMVSLWIGQGIYRSRLAKLTDGGMDAETAKRRSLTETWAIVESTQQSARTENMGAAQRNGGWMGRLLYQYVSSPAQQIAFTVQAAREALALKGAEGSKGKLLRVLFINYWAVPGMMVLASAAWRSLLGYPPDEKEETYWSKVIAPMMAGPGAGLVFAGTAADNGMKAFMTGERNWRSQGLPVENIYELFENLGITAHDLLIECDAEKLRADLFRLVKSTSAPGRHITQAVNNYSD